MEKLPKIFVLDTNVILHDHNAIYNFQENDLVIPIAVLEELDKFKKGNDTINYNAREFVRAIDKISDPRLFNSNKGYPLGKGRGKLSIEINHPFPPELEGCFMDDLQDDIDKVFSCLTEHADTFKMLMWSYDHRNELMEE